VLALCLVACGDVDPSNMTSTSISTSVSTSGSASGTGEETSGETTTDTPTGDPTTGSAGPGGREVCDRYIQCIAVTTPNGLPDAQAGFGDDSACWSNGPDDAELCAQACQTGLDQAHEAFPLEEKCYACLVDSECAADERCLKGDCTTTDCGDGIVDAEEVCDFTEGCALDCQGGTNCNPISHYGCADFEACSVVFYGSEFYETECTEVFPPTGGFGEGCGEGEEIFEYYACDPGLECVPESVADFSCDLDGCCTPYCDLGAPSCPMGFQCVAYNTVFASLGQQVGPVLAYLGVCIP
jgi:hypothetical protein